MSPTQENTGQDSGTHDTRIQVNLSAVVIRGHVALDLLDDPTAPILCDPRDLCLAGELDTLDSRCPGADPCDSRTAVSVDPEAVMITTGHADGCPWWEAVYADAIARDGAAIEALAAELKGGAS